MVKLVISAKTGGSGHEFGKPLDGEITAQIKDLFDYSDTVRKEQAHITSAPEDLILIERLRLILALESKRGVPHLTREKGEEVSVSFFPFPREEKVVEARYELVLTICRYSTHEPGGERYGIWGAQLLYVFLTPEDALFNQDGFVDLSNVDRDKGFRSTGVPVKDPTLETFLTGDIVPIGRAQAYVKIHMFQRGELFGCSLNLKEMLHQIIERFWQRIAPIKREPALV